MNPRFGIALSGILLLSTQASAEHAAPAEAREVEAQEEAPRDLRLDAGLTFSHFQQQAKPAIGAERGDRLIEQTELGVATFATYRLHDLVALGVFTQFDVGSRNAARFDGFDDDGRTQVSGQLGGDYWELWAGPLLKGQYQAVFAELGWGILGIRDDAGRSDLPDANGLDDGAFRTTPSVAWLIAIGAGVPLTTRLDLSLRVAYRVRYYTSRGGEALFDDSALGSQSIAPFVGVAWHP